MLLRDADTVPKQSCQARRNCAQMRRSLQKLPKRVGRVHWRNKRKKEKKKAKKEAGVWHGDGKHGCGKDLTFPEV